jgi:hypothetical protein
MHVSATQKVMSNLLTVPLATSYAATYFGAVIRRTTSCMRTR